jgi:hypothetical protein
MSDGMIGHGAGPDVFGGPRWDEFSVLKATSAAVDSLGKTYVVLYWTPHAKAEGYNIYRSKTPKISGRARPINGSRPIAPVRTCAELKRVIPPGSKEWEQLANAFSAAKSRKSMAMTADSHHRARFLDRSVLEGPRGRSGLTPDLGTISPGLLPWEVDPCAALERGLTAEEEGMFDVLTNTSLRFRLARGLAYLDDKVTAGEKYYYELRGVMPGGQMVVLATGILVIAGHYAPPDPPSGLSVTAGDRKVLALWNRNPYAFSYRVRRSLHPHVGYKLIHSEPVELDVERDLQGNKLPVPRPGLLDFQRWDEDGKPEDHEVNGVMISGPENGATYYYQVAGVDILDRQGDWSAAKQATPVCSTPPMAPDDLHVDPSTAPLGLALSWRKVTRNVENHQISDTVQYYKIYRGETQAEMEDLEKLKVHLVGTVTADPTDLKTPTLSWTDTDEKTLVPDYGEKDFWYRVRCVDQHGSVSAPSAVISGRIPDTIPPGPTEVDGAEGFADHIRIYWNPNDEPDLAGYQIYRGICDKGVVYQPQKDEKGMLGCDMVLVGAVSLTEAKKRYKELGKIYFDDYSVPSGSPLCYAYWVRAYDAAQNLYPGVSGCPAAEHEYVCQRLYEETPPPAPVITDLKARNNAVLVEWIASPIQDLRAFHIYRSEKENDPPKFVGCVLKDGTPYPDRWLGIKPSCEDIPAEPNPTSVHASFLDTKVEPNRVYWYRVSALDWLGNESQGDDLTGLPAISTFTYSCDLPPAPTLLPPSPPPAEGCGLDVRWNPVFDPQELKGFVVFRSDTLAGDYHQVSAIVEGNVFSDVSARRGVDYWYCIQALDRAGKLSPPSAPVKHRY